MTRDHIVDDVKQFLLGCENDIMLMFLNLQLFDTMQRMGAGRRWDLSAIKWTESPLAAAM